jgi:DDE superfamily endonuclease
MSERSSTITGSSLDESDILGSDDDSILILTGDDILRHGLKLLGWTDEQLHRNSKNKRQKHTDWFKSDYGASPQVVAQIFEDLQTTTIASSRIHSASLHDVSHLLFTLNFLKVYPTDDQRQNKWHLCDKSLREHCWSMLLRLQALKATKIVWPTAAEIGNNIFIGSVDGTHVETEEPNHPVFPKDKTAFSYKNHAAGLAYELVVSLFSSHIIWMNGPFPASIHDNKIFNSPGGLREKLQGTGLRLIGDSGYQGNDDIVSRLNSLDSPEVSKFKTRARLRHEAVNAKIKTLRCTDSGRFRHKGNHTDGQPKFKIFFEASVVVTQYKMEISEPLFDI